VAGDVDDEVAHGADHEQQTDGIANEPWHADQYPADEDDQSVEQIPGGQLSGCQPLLGAGQHSNADAPDDKGPKRAHDDQERQCPKEADLVGNDHERGDLGGDKQQQAEEEHTAG
jgi:hypothetical protein